MCKETSSAKELAERLLMKKRNYFEESDQAKIETMFRYAEGYKSFLDAAKTEREAVSELIVMAEKAGYKPYSLGMKLEVGGTYYYNNRGKNLFLFTRTAVCAS